MKRSDLLMEMRSCVTASQVPKLMGLSYQNKEDAVDVYNFMLGLVPDAEQTPAMRRGTYLQALVLDLYEFGDSDRNIEPGLPKGYVLVREPEMYFNPLHKSHKGLHRVCDREDAGRLVFSMVYCKETLTTRLQEQNVPEQLANTLLERFGNAYEADGTTLKMMTGQQIKSILTELMEEGILLLGDAKTISGQLDKILDITYGTDCTWLGSHPDALVYDPEGKLAFAVEVKTVADAREMEANGMYNHWYVQNQTTLLATGAPLLKLLVFDMKEFELLYPFDIEPEAQAMWSCYMVAKNFWIKHILAKKAPDHNVREVTDEVKAPLDMTKTTTVEGDKAQEIDAIAEEIKEKSRQKDELDATVKTLKSMLASHLGIDGQGQYKDYVLPSGRKVQVVWTKNADSFDWKKCVADHPDEKDMATKYNVVGNSYWYLKIYEQKAPKAAKEPVVGD